MIFQVKQKKQIVKIWMCIALCILFIQHLMLLVETNWRYYPTTYAILWNQFKFFFFNSSGELLFIFSRGINIKKLHIVQPSLTWKKEVLPVNATMYAESIWLQLTITINMPIVVWTLQCTNAIYKWCWLCIK